MTQLTRMNPDGPNGALEPISVVDPATVIDGEAQEKGACFMGDGGEKIIVGVWESTAYAEVFSGEGYPDDEFCQVLNGTATLTDAVGNAQSFDAGDSYVISKGWCGEFRVSEGFKKYYVVSAS
ncbi:cupin domain-containing protein [Roseibium sp.]|uniref:cupin domain-containing protein n=1 Tax=Roseibium sp. TaxID=1936156 RepID=UPI003D0D7F62